jgi:hypothetical protein
MYVSIILCCVAPFQEAPPERAKEFTVLECNSNGLIRDQQRRNVQVNSSVNTFSYGRRTDTQLCAITYNSVQLRQRAASLQHLVSTSNHQKRHIPDHIPLIKYQQPTPKSYLFIVNLILNSPHNGDN